MDNTIEQRAIKVISEQLGVLQGDIKSTSNLVDDLGADSLDTVELIMALEDEFVIDIPDEQFEKMTTVQSILDFIGTAQTA